MIEAIMYFALGFLIAAAIALTTLPAVWNRAVRLTRRRIESLVPVSLAEIQADKDLVRAEYAMAVRRLEITADNLQWKTAEQAVEIGRQAVSVLAMKAELAKKLGEKDAIIRELEEQGAALEATLAQTEQALAATEQALRLKSGALETAEAAIADKDQSLADLQSRLDEATSLAETHKGEIAALTAEVATLKAEVADLERQIAATSEQGRRERDNAKALSRTLAEQRSQAEQATARAAELDGRLAVQTREHDGLIKRISALEGELQSRDARPLVADDAAAARRDADQFKAEAEQGAVPARAAIDRLHAEKTALESALAQAREERAKLQRELAQAKRQAESNDAVERAENELLRERIGDVAAEVARLTAQLEGPQSPIGALIAEPVWVNGAAGPREAPSASLADRIRALQTRASRTGASPDAAGQGA